VKQNGHAEGLIPRIRQSLGAASHVAFGIDLPNGIKAGIFLATYVILEWVSFIHEYKGLPITPWNPGLGVVFALMVFGGARFGVVLFAGVILAEILVLKSKLEWPIILSIAAIIAVDYGVVASVLRKRFRIGTGLNHLSDVLVLLFAGISGAIIVALMLSMLLLTDAEIDFGDVFVTFVPLLVGDAIGIAVMTPLTLRLILNSGRSPIRFSRTLVPEILLYVLLMTVALWIIIGAETVNGFKFFYLLFLPVVVAAVRHGLDGACVSLAFSQIALVGLLHIHSYDARAFTEFQTLMFILTATGLIVGVVVSERETADRLVREAEARLKEKESEAAQAARFNLVSGMASALIHEINQPMTAARALGRSAQHILRAPGGDLTRADSNLTTMIAQIDHAGGVVRRMRDFLRRGRPHVSTIDVRSMLEEALMLVRTEAVANQVRIELGAPNDLPALHGDRTQLEQVVLNLVRNAIESIVGARKADGRIRIAAYRLDAPQRVEIGVSDNGPGVDHELADRLFEPLATSKEAGLGLGLPICVSIVESHGGRLWLHSREAGATEFRFSLPLDQSQVT
jgi:two-component system, LuxR family, sensor kinase FixL